MPTRIQAVDEIEVPFPPETVWRALADIAAYSTWWPAAIRLRVTRFVPGLVGSEIELRPRGGRAFRCRIDAVDPPRRLRTEYVGGFISGLGEWRLEPSETGTRVSYEVDVRAEGRLVAWIGRILPLARVHSHQMQAVLRGLGQMLARSGGRVP